MSQNFSVKGNSVEKLLDHGEVSKWKDHNTNEKTRKIENNLDGPDLIQPFEEAHSKTNKDARDDVQKEKDSNAVPANKYFVPLAKKETKTGFERGLEPEKILGAAYIKGKILFLMKWKNIKQTDLVPSTEANKECPQIVIKFYEERLNW